MQKIELQKLLDDFIDNEYEDEKSEKTLKSYRQEIEVFLAWLPESFEINKKLMIDFKKYIQEHFKPTTQNHYIVVVNKFIKYCGFSDSKLKKVKVQTKSSLNEQIEDQEHKRMLRWAKKMGMIDMYYIIRLFAESGIRVVELKDFKLETLDWCMEIYNKGKYREIIIPNDLVRELRKYCKEQNITEGYIFKAPKKPESCISPGTVWDRLKRIAKKAKINPRKIHPHAWRHYFAKHATLAGININELMDLMGHNNPITTGIYTRTSSKEKRKKIEAMRKIKEDKDD